MFNAPFPAEPILCAEGAVKSAWIDFNDHMNVGYYLVAFDEAHDVFFENWMDLNAGYAARSGMGSFILQSHLHYLKELRLGARYQVRLQLLDADAKRWHYVSQMIRAEDGAVAASCEQIAMNVDHATRRSAPLPEPQAARLQALLAVHKDLPRPDMVGRPLGIRRG